jgi:hypothetical protein
LKQPGTEEYEMATMGKDEMNRIHRSGPVMQRIGMVFMKTKQKKHAFSVFRSKQETSFHNFVCPRNGACYIEFTSFKVS